MLSHAACSCCTCRGPEVKHDSVYEDWEAALTKSLGRLEGADS